MQMATNLKGNQWTVISGKEKNCQQNNINPQADISFHLILT